MFDNAIRQWHYDPIDGSTDKDPSKLMQELGEPVIVAVKAKT